MVKESMFPLRVSMISETHVLETRWVLSCSAGISGGSATGQPIIELQRLWAGSGLHSHATSIPIGTHFSSGTA